MADQLPSTANATIRGVLLNGAKRYEALRRTMIETVAVILVLNNGDARLSDYIGFMINHNELPLHCDSDERKWVLLSSLINDSGNIH